MTSEADFLLVGSDGSSSGLHVGVDERRAGEVSTADAFLDFRGRTPAAITRFEVRGGRREDHYVEASLVPIILVSEELMSAFASAGLTGFTTYDVELEKRKDWPTKHYCGLAVRGRCVELPRFRRHFMLL